VALAVHEQRHGKAGEKMRPEKQAIVKNVRGKLEQAGMVVLVDYRGLNVEKMTELRAKLRDASGSVTVVSNAYFGIAAKELGWTDVDRFLSGPTAMICGQGDAARLAKVLTQYVKDNQRPVVKGGRLGTAVLVPAEIEALSKIPSREVLLGQFLGTLVAPMSQLVGVFSQKLSTILYVLKAIEDKKKGEQQ
jgi:large subunit ribosomal protein L10